MFTKTIVHQNEPEIEISSETPLSAKKDQKSDLKGKKKGDSKQESDATVINEEVKPHVYQWKSITADGQVYLQNSSNQEYEKIDQLRLILETNPKTTEVIEKKNQILK